MGKQKPPKFGVKGEEEVAQHTKKNGSYPFLFFLFSRVFWEEKKEKRGKKGFYFFFSTKFSFYHFGRGSIPIVLNDIWNSTN